MGTKITEQRSGKTVCPMYDVLVFTGWVGGQELQSDIAPKAGS
jgi:hypothetical protein